MEKTKILFLLGLFFSAEFSAQQMKEYNFGVPFSISYPAGYMKTYDLNDYAASQFNNAVYGKYSIIVPVEKDNLSFEKVNFLDIKEAGEYYSKMLKDGLDEDQYFKNSNAKEIQINQHKAAELTIEGTMADTEIKSSVQLFYLLTVVESADHYFQILSWCNLKDKNKNIEEFRKIAQSFTIRK